MKVAPAFAAIVCLLLAVPAGAAIDVGATSCSVGFRVGTANLDCVLATSPGGVRLSGTPVIKTPVAAGDSAAFTYDAVGDLTRATTGSGTSEYAYDAERRLLLLVDPSGSTNYTYDSSGRLVGADGSAFVYGDAGLIRATLADGRSIDYSYDAAGDLTAVADASNRGSFVYDGQGRVLLANVDGATTTYDYDSSGQPVRRVEQGETTSYLYDGRGRLVRSAGTDKTTFSYDRDGSLLQARGTRGQATRFAYDGLGRLTSISSSGGEGATFAYDDSGRLALVSTAIDSEVVVDFEEGDPDQPLSTGVVYGDASGRSFSLTLGGELRTCSACP